VTSELSPMSPGRLVSYDQLGAHRHLLISERLRTRRRDLGLTQKEVVARLRRIGVATTNKALSSLEHGAGLDVCKLPELARALDCSLTYLVGLNDDPASWEPDFESWPGRRPSRERTTRLVSAGRKMPPGTGPHILGPL
jgi:transcriptional regulator with XRE-family HTH domain